MQSRGKFSEIAVKASGVIRKKNGVIADVDLMMELDFTPDTWKTWKPKFIELFDLRELSDKDESGNHFNYHIVYNKKLKQWMEEVIIQ